MKLHEFEPKIESALKGIVVPAEKKNKIRLTEFFTVGVYANTNDDSYDVDVSAYRDDLLIFKQGVEAAIQACETTLALEGIKEEKAEKVG